MDKAELVRIKKVFGRDRYAWEYDGKFYVIGNCRACMNFPSKRIEIKPGIFLDLKNGNITGV